MLAFVVPVKSKKVTSDWRYFSILVNRTIHSICNQTNPNFEVIIACHEIPDTQFMKDSRVTFLQVDFAPPVLNKEGTNHWIKEADKGKKIKFAVEHAQNKGIKYIMTVDSDDCISNKISDFVHKNATDTISGWYSKKGYLYPEGKRYAYLNLKNFHTLCGSCVIIKPELIHFMYGENHHFDHERHQFTDSLYLKQLPFPAAIYSMLNGANHFLDDVEMQKKQRRINPLSKSSLHILYGRLRKYRLVPLMFLRKEFAIQSL